MTSISELKSRAGLLLNRQLPEEYRFLDLRQDGEPGDLEAYLHGFGHLLDLIRGTTEQSYADAFAEEIDFPSQNTLENRTPQSWILPYLAELVGAELLAPVPAQRIKELSETVSWFKTKGTLRSVNSVADIVSGFEVIVNEGWRRVAMTPRLKLPPFASSAPSGSTGATGDDVTIPLGTPDLRRNNRAVLDDNGSNPLQEIKIPTRSSSGHIASPIRVYFKPLAPTGTPCFPDAYDDTSVRTPDVRDPSRNQVGPHPRRTLLHVRPPFGFFEPGIRVVTLPATTNPLKLDLTPQAGLQRIDPTEVLKAFGDPVDADGDLRLAAPDKIIIQGNVTIPPGIKVRFQDLLFRGTIEVAADSNAENHLDLSRCAVAKLKLRKASTEPVVEADDCLLGEVFGPTSFARLIHCTVLEKISLDRLQASDCIFSGPLVDLKCSGQLTCLRYSRLSNFTEISGCDLKRNPHLVTDDPNFISLYFQDGDNCVLRPAVFGEPGCGVLDTTCSTRISSGAENAGEMGAYNHLHLSERLDAMRRKLEDFLPFGQDISLRYDAHLSRRPAKLI
jgi:hypothetical protein